MELIARDTDLEAAAMLDGYAHPAILVSADYRILATNDLYRDTFGQIEEPNARCYEVSHGYKVPCDQAGESCPLVACRESKQKERVLHIHQTPRGSEHVDVEMLPITDASGELKYFVEILRPLSIASAELNTEQMVGRSDAFNEMLDAINLVAPHEASVLLYGESGTGKELAAAAIHQASTRSASPLVTIECAGLNETLFESELFGHIKGSFTGATQTKPGLLETAEGGTLFLDEIGDVPLGMQVKLLRLLESRAYRAVGSTVPKHADFRLVCATNCDLQAMTKEGTFREDLFHRINAFPIHLPPLRERGEDLLLIANSILARLDGDRRYRLTESAVNRLRRYPFPGNVRELRNVLERASIFAHSQIIDAQIIERCLPAVGKTNNDSDQTFIDLKSQERRYLQSLMTHCGGDKARVAKIAGISLRSLYRKLES